MKTISPLCLLVVLITASTAASQTNIPQWVTRFDDRDPTVREASIRHLWTQPQVAAELVVQAFRTGNLNVRLTALELLREWKAPVEELDPWQPQTITPERLAALETWQKEIAASTELLSPRELTETQLAEATEEIARMLRVTDAETEVIRERLARMGSAFLPLVYERLKTATTDRERQRLAALRYRLVANETLAQRWSPDGLLHLAATETALRRKSVDELANLATAEDQMLLRELFSDPDPLVREIALRGLRKIGGETQTILLDLLGDPEPNVRAAVLKQLEDNPGVGTHAKIIEYVRMETDADLVSHAVRVLRALRQQGNADATRCLIELLKHDSWQVRADSAAALGMSVRNTLATVTSSYTSTFVDGKVIHEPAAGASEAAQLQDDVNAALAVLLADPDSFVVSKAVEGLRNANKPVDFTLLLQAMERSPDLAGHIVEMVADDSRMWAQTMPQLVKLTEHENPQIRAAIFGSAPKLGEKELTAGLSDHESAVRIAAAKAVVRQLDALRSGALRTSRSSYFPSSSWEPALIEPPPTVFSSIGRLFGFGSTSRTPRPPRPVVAAGGAVPHVPFDPVIDGIQPRFPVVTALDGDEIEEVVPTNNPVELENYNHTEAALLPVPVTPPPSLETLVLPPRAVDYSMAEENVVHVPVPVVPPVIPGEAGIQTEDVDYVPQDIRLRGDDGETEPADDIPTNTNELQNYIARNSSTITPEAYDRWLTNFNEGGGRPEWTANLVEPLEAMLVATSKEEQVTAAVVLVLLGKSDEMVPFLIETAKANPDFFDSLGQIIPWLNSDNKLAIFQEWRTASEPNALQIAGFLRYLAEPADLRHEPIYWELLGEADAPLDMVDSLYELLKPLYMIDYDFDHSNRSPKSVQAAMTDKLSAWAEKGTEYQQLVALAMLVAVESNKAREVAERLDADATISDELRFDAFQVRLMTQANDGERTAFAVETLKQKDPKRSRLAIRSLVDSDRSSFQVLRNRLFVYSPSAMRSVSLSSQRNAQVAPPGLELESIQPLLKDENEGIAAYAGYFAVLLGDATGMEPLLKYWRKTQTDEQEVEDDERTIVALVYRAIGSLDDAQYVPVLREIYGKIRDYEVRDFYWHIRNMTGPEILDLRKEIRDKHGMANLQ